MSEEATNISQVQAAIAGLESDVNVKSTGAQIAEEKESKLLAARKIKIIEARHARRAAQAVKDQERADMIKGLPVPASPRAGLKPVCCFELQSLGYFVGGTYDHRQPIVKTGDLISIKKWDCDS